jgi:hypothetical protein
LFPGLFTFEFQFEFWGVLPALFYPYDAFLSESKTPPGVPVRALIIEKRVHWQNLVRLTACSSDKLPRIDAGILGNAEKTEKRKIL